MENKTGNYLKYAIGEIVLVVIGILIALQINNWNEQRKERKKATEYLFEFKKDLASDTTLFNSVIDSLSIQISAELDVLKRKMNTWENADAIATSLFPRSYSRSINQRTFDNVQNSGKSTLSGYENLYEQLTYYYTKTNADFKVYSQWSYDEFQKSAQTIYDFINNGNYEYSLNYNQDILKELNVDSVAVFDPKRQPPTLEWINSISGRNYITQNLIRHVQIRRKYISYNKEANELLVEIEEELERNK